VISLGVEDNNKVLSECKKRRYPIACIVPFGLNQKDWEKTGHCMWIKNTGEAAFAHGS